MALLARELLIPAIVSLGLTVAVAIVGPLAMQRTAWPEDQAPGGSESCLDTPVRALSASSIEGQARLCIADTGLRPSMWVSGLRAGEVYTAWLAYFEQPAACLASPCQLIDLQGYDPVGVLGRVDGAIAPPPQELQLQGDLRDVKTSSGAQVTPLLFAHGPAHGESSRARARQLLSVQTPELGAPLAGAAVDGGRAWPLGQAIFVLR